MKNVYVLGNGYSINLLKLLKESSIVSPEVIDRIDLNNLFSKGDCVPCPDGSIGYLSKKYCPQLWKMGIRSTITTEKANEVINNIIISHRICMQLNHNHKISLTDNEYMNVYYELLNYLKRLFIYYNGMITDDDLIKALNNDKIKIPIIDDTDIAESPSEYAIITYNYDVFFERLLKLKNINYSIFGFPASKSGVVIYKPHGSISFDLIRKHVGNVYDITCEDIVVKGTTSYDYLGSVLIPPHGFIVGDNTSWVKKIRDGVGEAIKSYPQKICFWGIAYNYVDRDELNEIITDITLQTHIEYVNPYPSSALDHIFSTIFKNYIHRK